VISSRKRPRLIIISLIAGVATLTFLIVSVCAKPQIFPADANFLVFPYVQLGNEPGTDEKQSTLDIRWAAFANTDDWALELKFKAEQPWTRVVDLQERPVQVGDVPAFEMYDAHLTGLAPDQQFDYRVVKNGKEIFKAKTKAPKARLTADYKFVVFGDCGAGTIGQRQVAFHIAQDKPDFVVITGDLVYNYGRALEYFERFFPVFNSNLSTALTGASMMRSLLFIAVPGNHDLYNVGYVDVENLDMIPDALAYYYFWKQPLNGPISEPSNGVSTVARGSDSRLKAFTDAAGKNYPRMSNYSFDYGNSHWTVLDGNPYMDWTRPVLRDWLEQDLAGSKAQWKFVAFHQPPFSTGAHHFAEQHMRLLCDIFEKYNVDIVFSGHMHNYQRTYPLKFSAQRSEDGKFIVGEKGRVSGDFSFDQTYDGKTNTQPKGVIYIVTGAGGAKLYDESAQLTPDKWEPYTKQFIANQHSYTLCDMKGTTLSISQRSQDGLELDQFKITKMPAPAAVLVKPAMQSSTSKSK
jgi:acid phosphatase type 7